MLKKQYFCKTQSRRIPRFDKEYKLGDAISVEHFIEGEFVDVSGTSKGKDFKE